MAGNLTRSPKRCNIFFVVHTIYICNPGRLWNETLVHAMPDCRRPTLGKRAILVNKIRWKRHAIYPPVRPHRPLPTAHHPSAMPPHSTQSEASGDHHQRSQNGISPAHQPHRQSSIAPCRASPDTPDALNPGPIGGGQSGASVSARCRCRIHSRRCCARCQLG